MMDDLNTLAGRVEAATGPDRELDAAIANAVGAEHGQKSGWSNGENGDYFVIDECAPRYTASIDAALTLVPDGWSVLSAWNPTGRCKCDLSDGPMDGQNRTWIGSEPCPTPALALTAAALRAGAKP